MHNFSLKIITLAVIFIYGFDSYASRLKERDYFASLRSSKSNIRFGPGMNYDVKYILKLKLMPIKVTAEYDNWLEIKDFEGEEGWVNKSLITKRKTSIVVTNKKFITVHKSDFSKSKTVVRLENNVILDVVKCTQDWCYIKVESKKGWVKKSSIWGWKGK